MPHSAWNFK